jgi:hypothetical protein
MKSNLFVLLFIATFCANGLFANDPAYELRRSSYISTALANFNDNAIVIQAYENQPLNMTALNNTIGIIGNKSTSDFDIVKLVRVMYLTNGEYDSIIMNTLDTIPFWLTKSDTLRGYWSENHMIMWMSSDWLLHEKFGKTIDDNLDNRLRHYLKMKIKYGFYEFFSSTYAPYCLSGLLNLADFAQDTEIKTLATQAANRLLKEMLWLTNNKGVFFPTAGRNYIGKYATPYGQNHNSLIYLLTGMGLPPDAASHSGVFLATSSLAVDSISKSWTSSLDTVYYMGHPLDSASSIYSNQPKTDKTIFHWSFGGYFHPSLVVQTGDLLNDSLLWRHTDFKPFYQLSTVPQSDYPLFADALSVASKSSVLTGQNIAIYKRNAVTLSSIQDFWKGKLGYQQYPCVANIGTSAVYLASGIVDSTWTEGASNNANEHLPYVEQKKNVALLMYRPEPKPGLLPYFNNEVVLRWLNSDFDEQQTSGNWLIGRQAQSYVGVRRHCIDKVNGSHGCYYTTDGQAWVIVLGDSSMYGSFSNFNTLIQQSQFEEQRYFDSVNNKSVYYAKIIFDNNTIDYAWDIDSIRDITGIVNIETNQLAVYPNPIKDEVKVDMEAFKGKIFSLEILNISGQKVFEQREQISSTNELRINTSNYPQGIYLVSLNSEGKTYRSRVVKVE